MFQEIGILHIFPAILEFFECTATAFREAGIAYLTVGCQYLSAGGSDGLLYDFGGGAGNALVTLAMVVCTDVETGVVFTVVPTD